MKQDFDKDWMAIIIFGAIQPQGRLPKGARKMTARQRYEQLPRSLTMPYRRAAKAVARATAALLENLREETS